MIKSKQVEVVLQCGTWMERLLWDGAKLTHASWNDQDGNYRVFGTYEKHSAIDDFFRSKLFTSNTRDWHLWISDVHTTENVKMLENLEEILETARESVLFTIEHIERELLKNI